MKKTRTRTKLTKPTAKTLRRPVLTKAAIDRFVKKWDFDRKIRGPRVQVDQRLQVVSDFILQELVSMYRRNFITPTQFTRFAEQASGTFNPNAHGNSLRNWAGVVTDWALYRGVTTWLELLPTGVSSHLDSGLFDERLETALWSGHTIRDMSEVVNILAAIERSREETTEARRRRSNSVACRLREWLQMANKTLVYQLDNAQYDDKGHLGLWHLISCDESEGPEAKAIVRRIVATVPAMLNTLTTVRPGDSARHVSSLCNWPEPERTAKPAA